MQVERTVTEISYAVSRLHATASASPPYCFKQRALGPYASIEMRGVHCASSGFADAVFARGECGGGDGVKTLTLKTPASKLNLPLAH